MYTHIYEASAAAMEILYIHLHIYTGCVDKYTCTLVWPTLQSVLHSQMADNDPGSLIMLQYQNNTWFGVGGENQPKECLWHNQVVCGSAQV